jgi:hypothetical protein
MPLTSAVPVSGNTPLIDLPHPENSFSQISGHEARMKI